LLKAEAANKAVHADADDSAKSLLNSDEEEDIRREAKKRARVKVKVAQQAVQEETDRPAKQMALTEEGEEDERKEAKKRALLQARLAEQASNTRAKVTNERAKANADEEEAKRRAMRTASRPQSTNLTMKTAVGSRLAANPETVNRVATERLICGARGPREMSLDHTESKAERARPEEKELESHHQPSSPLTWSKCLISLATCIG